MLKSNEALQKLIYGNKRFVEGDLLHPNRTKELRETLLSSQKPFAAVISCSDSRVPIEIVFDAGIGDLFVVRSAGHVLSKETLGSIEYAVESLGVKLVVILGHENCGAIKSALSIYNKHEYENLTENMKALMSHIYPVLEKLNSYQQNPSLNTTTCEFIKYQVEDFKRKSPNLAKLIKENKLKLVGAHYPLETGLIEFYE